MGKTVFALPGNDGLLTYYADHMKHTVINCWQNMEILTVILSGKYCYHWACTISSLCFLFKILVTNCIR